MTDSRSALAETLREIDVLLAGLSKRREDVLKVDELALEACLTTEVVTSLLDGKEPPEEDLTGRIIERTKRLRETRLRPDGKQYSLGEIGKSFGGSRAVLPNLVNGNGGGAGPMLKTIVGIETFFFGEPTGLLSAEPASALNAALRKVAEDLRLSASLAIYGVHKAAARSADPLTQLSPGDRKLVESLIGRLVKEAEGRQDE